MKLLPCPFCGKPAEADSQRGYRNMRTGNLENAAAVYCTACNADMTWCYRDTPDIDCEAAMASLVDQWNTRAPSTAEVHDIRWAVNVLLEQIAAKFDTWSTMDVWRSDAAQLVRGFKHDLSKPSAPHS